MLLESTKFCPEAVEAHIVNPVNSVVFAMTELWVKKGLKPNKVVGLLTLGIMRVNKFVDEITGADVDGINIPIVGGHAGSSFIPFLSPWTGSILSVVVGHFSFRETITEKLFAADYPISRRWLLILEDESTLSPTRWSTAQDSS